MTLFARRLGFALTLTAAGAAGMAVGSLGWCWDRARRRWSPPGTWRSVDDSLLLPAQPVVFDFIERKVTPENFYVAIFDKTAPQRPLP